MEDPSLKLKAAIANACDKGDLRELAQAQLSLVKLLTMQIMARGSVDSSSLEEAVQLAREVVKNASSSQNSTTEALAWSSLGQLLALGGETAEPLRCFERALAIYVRIGDNKGAATCCSGLAGICIKTRDLSRATEVLRQGIRYSTLAGDLEAVEQHKLALSQIGALQRTLGDVPGAGSSPGIFSRYFKVLQNYVGINGRQPSGVLVLHRGKFPRIFRPGIRRGSSRQQQGPQRLCARWPLQSRRHFSDSSCHRTTLP